ncbi:MAG TPA: PilZ domain-containing protein [Vicinamibacterales bacterium]|nr:PilZ domain-containing protein [Vicinamibacterales bacterium]
MVIIAALNLTPSLCERLANEGELLTFADTEPIQALQTILEQHPRLIVLERLFAATPRGAALINRIKTDPQVAQAEIRVMSHTGDYTRVVARGAGAAAASESSASATAHVSAETASVEATAVETLETEDVEEETPESEEAAASAPRQLDWHGTRRAARYRIRQGVEIQLDGNPASLVDLSVMGAQVISATILRPNQRVRISVPTDDFVMRFRGAVAWAKFELPKPTEPPRYRAGVEFNDADPAAMDEYCNKHKL